MRSFLYPQVFTKRSLCWCLVRLPVGTQHPPRGITAARSSDWVSDSAYWNYTVDTTPTVGSDVHLTNQSDGGAGIPGTFTFTPKVKDIASVNGQVAVATDSELHVLLQLRADCHGQSRSRWCGPDQLDSGPERLLRPQCLRHHQEPARTDAVRLLLHRELTPAQNRYGRSIFGGRNQRFPSNDALIADATRPPLGRLH